MSEIKTNINPICKWCYRVLDKNGECYCSLPEKDAEQASFEGILDACKDLRWKKNLDYGGAYKICGTKGIIVRLVDKVMRLKNIVLDSNNQTIPESVEQNLQDILVLAGNALYLESEKKK